MYTSGKEYLMKNTDNKLTEVVPGVLKKNDNTFYIVCTVKGTHHYCSKDRLDKLAKKAGSLEAVGASYVSREAKRVVKQAADAKAKAEAPPKVRRQRRNSITTSDEPARYTRLPGPPDGMWKSEHVKATLARVTPILSNKGEKCLRPDLWKQNGTYCNGCEYFNFCTNKFKEWKTYQEQGARDCDQIFSKVPCIYKG